MRASIASIFGAKQVSELQPFASTSLPASGEGEGEGAVASPFEVEGFISRPREGSGRRTGDRQYVYVNRRPVDFPYNALEKIADRKSVVVTPWRK